MDKINNTTTIGAQVIAVVLAELGVKAPTLAKEIGVTYNRLRLVQVGRTEKISGEIAALIHARYPQFPLRWLIEGGERNGIGLPTAMQRLLDAKDDEIASLRAQVYALQCILGEKSNDRHAQGDL